MLLRVDNVTKSFDGFMAISEVDLTVEPGQMASIIGPNGAGKSTLFNLITGHLTPTRGRVFFHDKEITGKAPQTTYKNTKFVLQECYVDPSKAITELGLPQTPIETAIKDSVEWFRANGYV